MIYTHDLLIPKQTAKETPVLEALRVTKGFVYRVEFEFPAGCAGLVHVVVLKGGFQLWPSTLGRSFHTDNYTIAFEDSYLIEWEPFVFSLYGWNEDDTYPHTIGVRIGVVSSNMFIARFLPTAAYQEYQNLVVAQRMEEERQKQALIETPFPWLEPARRKA